MRTKLIFLFFSLTLVVLPAVSQSPEKEIDNMMQYAASNGYFNGSMAVIEKGKVIYKKSFGFANFHTQTPNTNESMYELGSVAKQFTALAIMILKEKGKLSYSDSLRKYFPELPYANITIRHMLHHTSGLPDYINGIGFLSWDPERIYTNKDAVAEIAKYKLPILFKPGEKYEYCNTGYMLLASIVEKVSGSTFDDFIRKNIFLPLGMTNSGVFSRYGTSPKANNQATLSHGFIYDPATNKYELPENIPQLRIVRSFAGIVGDGGIGSSLDDQIKWHQALFTNKLIRPESMQEAITSGKLNNGTPTGYGFGWFVQQDPTDGAIIQHTGGWSGVRNAIVRWLDKDRVLIVLRNNEIDFRGIQEAVKNILNGQPYVMPKPSLAQALAFAASEDKPGAIYDRYNELKPDKAAVNEMELNQMGYLLMEANKIKSAIAILKINTELFPQSGNVFDSLGEAYLKAGDKENAKMNYQKALELNPANDGAKKVLEQLNK